MSLVMKILAGVLIILALIAGTIVIALLVVIMVYTWAGGDIEIGINDKKHGTNL